MLLDRFTGRQTSLIDSFDRSVESPVWSLDGQSIYFNAEDQGEMPLWVVAASGGQPRLLTPGQHAGEFDARGNAIVAAMSSLGGPAELYSSLAEACGN